MARPEPIQADEAEYRVKAAYIYNFANFVTWPVTVLAAGEPLEVCVLGDNPFGGALEPITSRTVAGRSLRLRYLERAESIEGCRVLFVGSSERYGLGHILEQARQRSVLTVGEIPDFALQGGVIGFVVRDGKVRLEINSRAARRASLKISAKLLEVATIVE